MQACQKFMSEEIDKDLVKHAMMKRDSLRKKMEEAVRKFKDLRRQFESSPTKGREGERRLGASKEEISETNAQKMLLSRKVHEQEKMVRKLRDQFDEASELVATRQAKRINAASNFVRDANFRAREEEMTQRETKLNTREVNLESATQQLEATAERLKRARDTELVVNFPRHMEELKVRTETLDKREEEIATREKHLALQAKIMKAKIQAFNAGVAKTIKRSITNAGHQADKWGDTNKVSVSKEVDGFEHMLTTINEKFSTGHGARTADRIAQGVKTGLNDIKEITNGMNKAANAAAEKGVSGEELDDESAAADDDDDDEADDEADPEADADAIDSIKGGVKTEGTLDTSKVTHDADTSPSDKPGL